MTLPNAFEDHLPSTGDVAELFADEIAALGGTLVDVFDDGDRLLARALLLDADDVTPGDTIRGGIAIHVQGTHVGLHAYTQRLVCTNGAIGAMPCGVFHVERARAGTPIELVTPVHDAIRDAMRQCAESPAFAESIAKMRLATGSDARRTAMGLPVLLHEMSTHAPVGWNDRVLHEIMHRYIRGDDRSLFGLLNAVTSTARDEPDPAHRWALEEVGGRLLEGAMIPRRIDALRASLDRLAESRSRGQLVGAGAAAD